MNVVVLWEEGFPFVDTKPLKLETVVSAFGEEHEVMPVRVDELPQALEAQPDLFVNPYGSAFPKSAWVAFTAYLMRGGNWVNLGGAPVSRPVRRENNAWRVEIAQPAYGKELYINQAYPIDIPDGAALKCPTLDVDLETSFRRFTPMRAWALQPRFTTRKDLPDEQGASGPREGQLHSLAVMKLDGRTIAAPVVAIDRTDGDYAGGRWVFAACEGDRALPGPLIARLCDYATRPHALLNVRATFACYYPGEMAALVVNAQCATPGDLKINLRVYARKTQKEIYAHTYRATANVAPAVVQTSPFPVPDPGFYIVRANVEAQGRSKPVAAYETGFWVYDRYLISGGAPITVDRDYFYRDGKPMPITGTTYMSGDAQRKFLFEPNPAVWDADMEAMKEAGVNLLRTGIWTGWKRIMLDAGAVDEGVLRALTAYLLTARRYDLPVIFNLFSFLPEAWGGENPYLDPRAVAAQTAFVAAFARRFANVNDLMWDFINEPSFCSPDHIWKCRPNYDRHERSAWADWLSSQGVSDDEWRERWRLTPNDPLDLPALQDFEDGHTTQGRHPLRALDYRRFAQDKFRQWAAHMAQVVRENGNPNQLVTVGQDEGGAHERPNTHFYGPAVDFTSNHSWWLNDHLLWDSIITKTPNRPNLIEETGIMYGERVDGRYLWSPEQARNLFERKMALSFAGGCAGFIQWQWNTNVYMDSDIEVGIGMVRADGSEKPELESFRSIAQFMAQNAHRMVGRKQEDVCVVIPHSNMLGPRDTATRATQNAIRNLTNLGLPCRVVSEHRADEAGDAKLIVLPSPHVLTEACWQALLAKVHAGATLLVTGVVEQDEYWRPVERLKQFGVQTTAKPVGSLERLGVSYLNDGVGCIECADTEPNPEHGMHIFEYNKGKIIYDPLPMELRDICTTPITAYGLAAKLSSISMRLSVAPVITVRYGQYDLVIIYNDTNLQFPCDSQAVNIHYDLRVPAGRIALAFVDRATDNVVAKYEVE